MGDPLRTRRDAFARWDLLRAAEQADRCLARHAGDRPELAPRVAAWRRTLQHLPQAARETEVRFAVVGAVKSGKSTLVNALLGEDVLPRGSGILTAQVTEVRGGPRPRVELLWKSRPEVDREFAALLTALGCPGHWEAGDDAHRQRAREVLEGRRAAPTPEGLHLESILRGLPRIWPLLGVEPRRDLRPGLGELAGFAARDEVAVFLRRLAVEVPIADLPEGLILLDCQGADAWHGAHSRDVDEALARAHGVLYVISSRVGLREADFRLLEALRGYGLLELTRFVLNRDLSGGEALDRVEDAVRDRLGRMGWAGPLWSFSALQALLERRLLIDPDAVPPAERRLAETWDDGTGDAQASRERFAAFREALWTEAARDREGWVLRRGRAELRRVLVEAAREIRAGSLERAARESDQADRILAWAEARMRAAAQQGRARVEQQVETLFAARRSPQRRLWERAVAGIDPDPASAWSEAGGDPAAAAAVIGERLRRRAAALLSESEPVRVNAVRNLALEVRGELARRGEALALEAERRLQGAGLEGPPPPDRARLSREITVTRPIPLFRSCLAEHRAGGDTPAGRVAQRGMHALGALGARLTRHLRGAEGLVRAQARAQGRLLLHRLRREWDGYRQTLVAGCLGPHVDEAAAQVYGCLASWVLLRRAGASPEGVEGVLASLERTGEAAPKPRPPG
ncbi:MAG: hypothetical protein Kow0092_07840 [Deferrisomatales bacterium]